MSQVLDTGPQVELVSFSFSIIFPEEFLILNWEINVEVHLAMSSLAIAGQRRFTPK